MLRVINAEIDSVGRDPAGVRKGLLDVPSGRRRERSNEDPVVVHRNAHILNRRENDAEIEVLRFLWRQARVSAVQP